MPSFDFVKRHKGISRLYRGYASGPKFPRRYRRMVTWWHRENRWYHASALPAAPHFLWIVPLHGFFALMALAALTATTVAGSFWAIMVSIPLLVGIVRFWNHMWLNGVARRIDFVVSTATVPLALISEPGDWAFAQWFEDQLQSGAPQFKRVYPIVDDYLDATYKAAKLLAEEDVPDVLADELRDGMEAAAKQAYAQLESLRRTATMHAARANDEEQANVAAQALFQEREDARIMEQNVRMVLDDMRAYATGYQALKQP